MNDLIEDLKNAELNPGVDSDLKSIKEIIQDGVNLVGPRDTFSGPSDPGNGGHAAVVSAT